MSTKFSLLSSMKGQQSQMDAISNNLANVNTPAFKKDQVLFREYYHNLVGQDLESEEEKFVHGGFSSPYNRGGASFVKIDQVSPEMHKGDIRPTNSPFDFALKSDAFFVVDTVLGERYTRNGRFLVDLNKFLITDSGDKVMGEDGPIKVEGEDISVGSDGQIIVDKKEVGTLKLVRFDEPARLTKVGNSYWAPSSPEQKPLNTDNPQVLQGVYEGSNVDAVQEMVKMIAVNRSYEAVQKAMQVGGGLDEQSITIAKV